MKVRLRLAQVNAQPDGARQLVFSGPKPADDKDKSDAAGIKEVTLAVWLDKDNPKHRNIEVGSEVYVQIGEVVAVKKFEKPKKDKK